MKSLEFNTLALVSLNPYLSHLPDPVPIDIMVIIHLRQFVELKRAQVVNLAAPYEVGYASDW